MEYTNNQEKARQIPERKSTSPSILDKLFYNQTDFSSLDGGEHVYNHSGKDDTIQIKEDKEK